MAHDPANSAAQASCSDTRLRTLMGGVSVFHHGHDHYAAPGHLDRPPISGRFYPDVEHVSAVCLALVLVWDTPTRLEHLPAVCRLDDTGRAVIAGAIVYG